MDCSTCSISPPCLSHSATALPAMHIAPLNDLHGIPRATITAAWTALQMPDNAYDPSCRVHIYRCATQYQQWQCCKSSGCIENCALAAAFDTFSPRTSCDDETELSECIDTSLFSQGLRYFLAFHLILQQRSGSLMYRTYHVPAVFRYFLIFRKGSAMVHGFC